MVKRNIIILGINDGHDAGAVIKKVENVNMTAMAILMVVQENY